ncbi:MAG: nucleoside hydrolase, partial [Candidatus Marinimicrobia bacterium]|nr:nucleoside hydrolase [Candidatus Neomarinimicrobiota bacterium]
MTKILIYGIALFILLLIFSQIDSVYATEKVIFDTDIGPDWDDVGATATLHALANSGEAEILAMMVSSGGHTATWGPPCLDAFNTYYGRPDIPIGVATEGPSFGSRYNQQIAEEFEQDLGIDNAWNSVELYRKILSEQTDSSVVIITTGFMTNLAALLKSEPDNYSALNGIDLVTKKVEKWVCMGGGFPNSGGEFNFACDAAATKYVVDNWPKPVIFSGAEIGSQIQTGAKLALTPASNPIRR